MKEQDYIAAIRKHMRLLGHQGHGVTEFRVFKSPQGPMVAYSDNEDDAVRLCTSMAGRTPGVYVGVQPRPLWLFDGASNQWKPALAGANRNCAFDKDIEIITTGFFDIDVVSLEHGQHPASDEELRHSLAAAQTLIQENGYSSHATICCSGNGHYVLIPIVPVQVDTLEVAQQFRSLCRQNVQSVIEHVGGARLDPVFNLSRMMRVMGTVNLKGRTVPNRPYRRACFLTEPVLSGSMELHYRILNTEVEQSARPIAPLGDATLGDPSRLETCEFIRWCRNHPQLVSEPQWFALITNLVHLKGGTALVHEISALDANRYEYKSTQRVIERVLRKGYQPQCCRSFTDNVGIAADMNTFQCPRIGTCPATAPMYITTKHATGPYSQYTTSCDNTKEKEIQTR